MEDKLLKLAYDALAILVPLLVATAAEYLRRRLGNERLERIKRELETKKELASTAVKFAEQAWRDLGGQTKYEAAAGWLAAEAQARGIKVTVTEIKGLIEAALREIKDYMGEEWAKVGVTHE